MEAYSEFSYWVFLPQSWVIVGIIFVAADIFLGYDFFVLPIGVAAFAIAGMAYAQQNMWLGDVVLFETWRDIGLYFAVLSLASVAVVKLVFQKNRSEEPDINDY